MLTTMPSSGLETGTPRSGHAPPTGPWVRPHRSLFLLSAVVAVAALSALGYFAALPSTSVGHAGGVGHAAPRSGVASLATAPGALSTPSLSLGVAVSPKAICAFGYSTCPASTGLGRVTLTADAGSQGVIAWPAVQVAFVVETTLYDGVYDPSAGEPGYDPCTAGQGVPCEESNGVPFFITHAQLIANGIAAANPHTQVSFAMVDYFGTGNDFNDYDGLEYHVDIADFVPATYFGEAVQTNFVDGQLGGGFVYGDSDFSDNMLHSSVITALYGTIIGSGLTWSNHTHHVIVWLGSTAPRDPNYAQNYCVSASNFYTSNPCYNSVCEPSYPFPPGPSPNCEGWIHSQDGNVTHSIAALAHTAKQCTGSIGGVCTIDAIDYVTTPTDPFSRGWPSGRAGGGPGGTMVQQNVNRVLLAGCDIAQATGGTWDGPAFFTCPNGDQGTLQYVPHGPATRPNTNNPTLFNALRLIGFGPVLQTQVAAGTGKPIFAYVPIGNIALPPSNELQPTATCLRAGAPTHTCQTAPTLETFGALQYLAWNWSTNRTQNVMYVGDFWSASFNVMATGPPYATVPVDACTTTECKAGGSQAVAGLYTWATYVPYSNNTVTTQSFPLADVSVEFTPPVAPPPTAPPPPAPVPPPFAIAAPVSVALGQPVGVGQSVGIASVSLQAAAAGFLAAGFLRVSLKNRPIALRVAAKAGPQASKFDKESMAIARDSGVGRFE